MLTFKNFTGINNVLDPRQLAPSFNGENVTTPLSAATDVDIGLDGTISRRSGYSMLSAQPHKNVWQAKGFILATTTGGDLISIAPNGTETTLYYSLGTTRVWYCNLPDGRTAFSNGMICGIASSTSYTSWGVPIPPSVGSAADHPGGLYNNAEGYRYKTTFVRIADGLESGVAYGGAALVTTQGGISITGLPTLANHRTNVYLNGYLAGDTNTDSFTFSGSNTDLMLPCLTEDYYPAPVGKVMTVFNGRVYVAVGSTLYASRPHAYEHFDIRRDFKQFKDPITMVLPTDDGVYVGTTTELAYLSGNAFDEMVYRQVLDRGVALGSGVSVQGEYLLNGNSGNAIVCIAGEVLTACFSGGRIVRITQSVYTTAATEVAATFRMNNNIPQYVAVPL